MFERWAYVLGTPPYNDPDLREGCLKDLPKLQFYYGDPGSSIVEDDGMEGCADVHTLAYRFKAPDGNEDGIAFCIDLFVNFRPFEELESSRYFFPPYYEMGFSRTFEELTFFPAKVMLHELMHHRNMYAPDVFETAVEHGGIIDVHIVDPTDKSNSVIAYGSFLAQKATVRDFASVEKNEPIEIYEAADVNPLWNDDNWVYFMAEHYVKTKLELPSDWQDSPDSRTGPHIPHGNPLAPPQMQTTTHSNTRHTQTAPKSFT